VADSSTERGLLRELIRGSPGGVVRLNLADKTLAHRRQLAAREVERSAAAEAVADVHEGPGWLNDQQRGRYAPWEAAARSRGLGPL
jgi:hypothetical protein